MDFMEIQRNMASRLAREAQMDHTVEVMSMMQSLIPDSQGRIPVEDVLIESQYKGMAEKEVLATLDQLARNGSIRQKEGYVYLY